MKYTRSALLLGFAIALSAIAAPPQTVEAIAKDPAKFDGKEVKASGAVEGFTQRTSKKGNKYFTFKLTQNKASLNVYSRGERKPLKNGDRVSVAGVFRKEKKVLDFTVTNEIDATPAKLGGKKNARVALIEN